MAQIRLEVFHSSLRKKGWVVREGGETLSQHCSQKEAEEAARVAGRNTHHHGGIGQAVFHRRDGSIREARICGRDPEHRAP